MAERKSDRFTTSQIPSSLESLHLEEGKTLFSLISCASLWSMSIIELVFMERLLKIFGYLDEKRETKEGSGGESNWH